MRPTNAQIEFLSVPLDGRKSWGVLVLEASFQSGPTGGVVARSPLRSETLGTYTVVLHLSPGQPRNILDGAIVMTRSVPRAAILNSSVVAPRLCL